jgi:hypothetical protein
LPFSEIKEASCNHEFFTIDKENIDTTNRVSFRSLITSRIKDQIFKPKPDNQMKDEFMRMLLIQAQTIESSTEFKSSASKSGCKLDAS